MRRKKILWLLCLFAFCMVGILALTLTTARRGIWELYLSSNVYEAIQAGNVSEVEHLLQRGANPNRHGAGGLVGGTPLLWTTEKSDLKIMKVLIQGGAEVDHSNDGGYTPLMFASSPQAAQLLLDAGANPRLKNNYGQTALQCAMLNKLPEVAAVLQGAETKLQPI
jgi:ankyrin repeat protein